jgi:transposase InsO family protein
VNHKRIARVMRAKGTGIKTLRRHVRTTNSRHDSPTFPNLYCNIIPTQPNRVWVGHVTYIRLASGFCHLAAILDACSRKVVGYAISRIINTDFALTALRSAVENCPPSAECIFHLDRAGQYASEAYRRALTEAGLRGSMSSVGNPYHNAQAESFMKALKVEISTSAATRHSRTSQSVRRGSLIRSTTPGACTPRLTPNHPTSLNANWSGLWLSSGPGGPAPGVHSTFAEVRFSAG